MLTPEAIEYLSVPDIMIYVMGTTGHVNWPGQVGRSRRLIAQPHSRSRGPLGSRNGSQKFRGVRISHLTWSPLTESNR